jgi:hypothetical protein
MHMCHVVNKLDNFVLLSPHSTCFQLLFNKNEKNEKNLKVFAFHYTFGLKMNQLFHLK